MNEIRKGYQQGDVLLKRVDALPQGAVERKAGARGFVLAEGEVTGHAHRVAVAEDVQMYERGGVLYLSVGAGGATVEHEEHHTQTVEPGIYEVGIVKEVDPFTDEVRSVQD